MKRIAVIIILAMSAVDVTAQPDTLWTRTYGGSGDYDQAYSIQQTTDGGYVVAGYTDSFGAGSFDFYVVKTNAQGDTLWTRTYGGSGVDATGFIRQTTDGGYVAVGQTSSFGAGGYDFYVVKTDGQGNTLWTRTYGGSGTDQGGSIQQTADGGYVVAGNTNSFGAGGHDFYVVKTNAQGDTLWTRTYGGSSIEYSYSIQQTADGGYVVAGQTSSFGAGNADFYLVKTDGLGNPQWTRTYGGGGTDNGYSMQRTADGGYVIAGLTSSFGAGSYDFYVVKTNAQGDTLWTRTYGGIESDYANSIRQTMDGGYVLAGLTSSFGPGDHDFYVVKTDAQGDTLWTRTYGGSNDDAAYSIQQTADTGYVVAGITNSFGAGGNDFYVVKTGRDPCFSTVPQAPQVVITTEGDHAHLQWNAITESVGGCPVAVTHYLVFYSPTVNGTYYFHGYTSDTTYTHTGVVRYATGMFYQVVASTAPLNLLATLPTAGRELTQEEVFVWLREDRNIDE